MELLAQTPAFQEIRDHVLELARLEPADHVLDIGAGTGLLAVAAAPRVTCVTALDVSPAMCRCLAAKLGGFGITNVDVREGSATALPCADGTVDVVVSNYCLHHLRTDEKRSALAEMARVLRPGGRVVVGDMMFGIGMADRRNRRVTLRITRRMIARGPAGIARLFRNAARVAAGRGEHPAPPQWWRDALSQAGFGEVTVRVLDHEGGIATARRP
jgi:ubiquinone/menaquinone biosynthesis C-methylase UbiE